jgi:uncharacterized Zn finger protein
MAEVLTSVAYLKEAKHRGLRCILLDLMIMRMLEDLPPDKRAHWTEELRMVDTRARALYDGPQVTQNTQRTISK